jgi:hypothetical protein
MIKTKTLKHVTFEWSTEDKILVISKSIGTTNEEIVLSRSEMGSLSRFIFSMFQFYSHKPRLKKTKEIVSMGLPLVFNGDKEVKKDEKESS